MKQTIKEIYIVLLRDNCREQVKDLVVSKNGTLYYKKGFPSYISLQEYLLNGSHN